MQLTEHIRTERIKWIDIYKGIAIILMIVGHCSGPLTKYVYVFHMGVFFFISGYTSNLTNKTIWQVLKNKFCSLMIPFYSVNILFITMKLIMEFLHIQKYYYNDLINKHNYFYSIKMLFTSSVATDLGGATWFLLILFQIFILSKILIIITKNKINIVTIILSFVLFLLSYFMIQNKVTSKIQYDLTFIGNMYFVLGMYFKEKKIFNYSYNKVCNKVENYIVIILSVIYLCFFTNLLKANVDYPSRKFNNPIVDLLSIVIAAILLQKICKWIENKKSCEIITYIGKNTLPLLLLHFLILRVIFSIGVYIDILNIETLKRLIPIENTYSWMVYTILIVIIFVIINKAFEKKNFYCVLFKGKFKLQKSINFKTNKFISMFCVGVILVVFIITFPTKVLLSNFIVGSTLDTAHIISGYYEDKWAAREFEAEFKSGEEGSLTINMYGVDKLNGNKITIFIDNKLYKEFDIKPGQNILELDVIKNKKIKLGIASQFTFRPNDYDKTNRDTRELAFVLNSINLK